MSIYTKSMSQIVTADLQELLDAVAVENARLEFKSEVPNKDDTLKKLSSFGNTFGGLMVVGAKANSSDGRIEGLPGVDEQDGYKQKLVQWCFEAVSPPLSIEVSDPISSPTSERKVCYVVNVPESDSAPHFLNGRKGIWVRTDEFSSRFEVHLADESQLRQLFDRRRQVVERRSSILERARRRFDTYASRIHTDTSGNRTQMGSRLELSLLPRFPSRPVCEQRDLETYIRRSSLQWCGIFFPRVDKGIITQHESAIILHAGRLLSIFEANIWGMVFYGTQVDGDHNGQKGIHLHEFVGSVLVFIRQGQALLQILGYSGPVLIETTLASIRGVPWLHSVQGLWVNSKPGSGLDDDVTFSITTTTEELRERPDGIAMDLLRYVFFSVNCPAFVEAPTFEAVVRSGYEFNSWRQPEKLKV